MERSRLPTILFGLEFSNDEPSAIISELKNMDSRGAKSVVTANVDHVVTLEANSKFRKAYENACVRTLDGIPLVWAAKVRRRGEPRRITGHDLVRTVLDTASMESLRYFIVAPTDSVAERFAAKLIEKGATRAAIATHVPPLGFERSVTESSSLANKIRQHNPDFLIMGVGAPKSEIWVDEHRHCIGSAIILNVGEALGVATGLVPRAPAMLQKFGLEWFFRFAREPRRLFVRYFIRSTRFVPLVLFDVYLRNGEHCGSKSFR